MTENMTERNYKDQVRRIIPSASYYKVKDAIFIIYFDISNIDCDIYKSIVIDAFKKKIIGKGVSEF